MSRQIKDGWLAEYLRWNDGLETPQLFDLWAGVSAIASTLERNVYLDRKYFRIFPNMYIIFVAAAAKCHKSTAIRQAQKILSSLPEPPRMFADRITPERLISFLAEGTEIHGNTEVKFKSTGTVHASELFVFFGKTSVEAGIVKYMTDLYDCPDKWKYDTKTAGTDELNDICVNFLGASTAAWLRQAIPVEAVGGGFLSRTVFVYQEEPKRLVPFPEDDAPEEYEVVEQRLIDDLAQIRNLRGKFTFSSEAKEWYREWYKHESVMQDEFHETDFYSRWVDMILKLGMIISVSESNDLVVEQRHLEVAHKMLDEVRENMHGVVDAMTTSDSEVDTSKILGFIKRRGRISHRQLMQYSSRYIKADGLKRVVETLEEAGEIRVVYEGERQARYYEYIGGDAE